MIMKTAKISSLSLLFAIALFFVLACKKESTEPILVEYAKVLLFHGAPTVDGVDMYIDGDKKTTNSLLYGTGSGYIQAVVTAHKLQTKNMKGTVIDSTNLSVKKDVSYSYYVYKDNDATGAIRTIATTDVLTAPAAGKAKIRIVNLIPDIPNGTAIDIQSVAPGGVPSYANDFTNVGFRGSRDFYEVPKGTYDLKVKFYTTTNPVIPYSSTTNITFAEGKIYTLVTHGFKSKTDTDPQAVKLSIIKNN